VAGTALNSSRDFFLHDAQLNSSVKWDAAQPFRIDLTKEDTALVKNRFQLIVRSTLQQPEIITKADTLFSNSQAGNQWLFNGNPVVGATQKFLVASQTGSYQVAVELSGCTRYSAPVQFAITSVYNNEPISIYPNPAQNQITIRGLTQETRYAIYDLHGKFLQAGSLTPAQNRIGLQLTAGLYVLSLQGSMLHRFKLTVK
jgi:hypothetical protein